MSVFLILVALNNFVHVFFSSFSFALFLKKNILDRKFYMCC